MVFDLDTRDMERWAVELRLYVEKAKRRFEKASLVDKFESVIRNQLPQIEGAGQAMNAIEINHINEHETRRLEAFIESIIENKCIRAEQHKLIQSTLRNSLQKSRRKSVLDSQGGQVEPICFFCAGDLDSNREPCQAIECGYASQRVLGHRHLAQDQMYAPSHDLHQTNPLTPPSSNNTPTPELNGFVPSPAQEAQGQTGLGVGQTSGVFQGTEQTIQADITEEQLEQVATDLSMATGSQTDANASNLVIDVDPSVFGPRDDDPQQVDEETEERVPPTPEEETEPGAGPEGTHEDSLHGWFENLNGTSETIPGPQRASTPIQAALATAGINVDLYRAFNMNPGSASTSGLNNTFTATTTITAPAPAQVSSQPPPVSTVSDSPSHTPPYEGNFAGTSVNSGARKTGSSLLLIPPGSILRSPFLRPPKGNNNQTVGFVTIVEKDRPLSVVKKSPKKSGAPNSSKRVSFNTNPRSQPYEDVRKTRSQDTRSTNNGGNYAGIYTPPSGETTPTPRPPATRGRPRTKSTPKRGTPRSTQ